MKGTYIESIRFRSRLSSRFDVESTSRVIFVIKIGPRWSGGLCIGSCAFGRGRTSIRYTGTASRSRTRSSSSTGVRIRRRVRFGWAYRPAASWETRSFATDWGEWWRRSSGWTPRRSSRAPISSWSCASRHCRWLIRKWKEAFCTCCGNRGCWRAPNRVRPRGDPPRSGRSRAAAAARIPKRARAESGSNREMPRWRTCPAYGETFFFSLDHMWISFSPVPFGLTSFATGFPCG